MRYKKILLMLSIATLSLSGCKNSEPIEQPVTTEIVETTTAAETTVAETAEPVTNAARGEAVADTNVVENTTEVEETKDEMQEVKDAIQEEQDAYSLDALYERLKLDNMEKDPWGAYEPTEDWMSAVNDATNEWSNNGTNNDFKLLAAFLNKLVKDKSNGEETYNCLMATMAGTNSLREWAAPYDAKTPTGGNGGSQSQGQGGNTTETQKPSTETSKPQENSGSQQKPQDTSNNESQPSNGGGGSMDHLFPGAEGSGRIDPNKELGGAIDDGIRLH